MPATINVNSLTVVHKSSGGVTMIFPDVCKTPSPAGPIPIPYPNIAMSSDTANGSKTVKGDGNPLMIKSSNFRMSTGDEAGSALGVVSNKIKGKAYPKLYSFDVKADGGNVFRLTDIMLQNGGSPTNTPPGTEVQAPLPPAIPDPPKPEKKPELTELKFDPTHCCCGDEVDVEVKSKDIDDGYNVPVTFEINGDGQQRSLSGDLFPTISGNKGKRRWRLRRGAYQKEIRWKLLASGLGGPLTSSNELEVRTAQPASELVVGQRITPQYVQITLPSGSKSWAPNGKNYGWEYAYDISIREGQLVVERKIDFDLIGGASASAKQKRRWKKGIEAIWDAKFLLHRKDCKRGDGCDCNAYNGCCKYALRVQCSWGAGHGAKKVALNKGANSPTDWGGPKWWYSHTWWEKTAGVPSTVRAHEFGHLIGMYDEYPAGACDPGRLYTNDTTSIMNSGRSTYARHFQEYADWFHAKAGGRVGPTELKSIR